ncbi:uncharacterized protein T551_01400 [Pneumocystis jirovecii RU7]|uniref:DNA-binding protein n=1 Tax=Pneumocystis jirovecii (strain RU7) TaxID=1408657 RepID=A0A0W4ZSJ1_PNEJ7|nr:uncharacterized protein T551_01400 [Pneumocystis jirovecii RU7]KTW31328.1 hypothetical protein T551_01400 [Pneumocystis jirovecii RU7]
MDSADAYDGYLRQSANPDKDSAEAQTAAKEARHAMVCVYLTAIIQLSHILEPAARDRLARIALVHIERARAVEEMLLRMAQQGTLRHKVTEEALIGLLREISGEETKETKIIYRRRYCEDDDI